jgi:hypothetical protein
MKSVAPKPQEEMLLSEFEEYFGIPDVDRLPSSPEIDVIRHLDIGEGSSLPGGMFWRDIRIVADK